MEDWREVPYLFANGKFWFECYNYIIAPSEIRKWDFRRGWVETHLQGRFEIKESKLMARPISDTSEEEKLEFVKLYWQFENDYKVAEITYEEGIFFVYYDHLGSRRRMTIDVRDMRMPQTIYLLRIGVYPFKQEEPQNVIWRYENG